MIGQFIIFHCSGIAFYCSTAPLALLTPIIAGPGIGLPLATLRQQAIAVTNTHHAGVGRAGGRPHRAFIGRGGRGSGHVASAARPPARLLRWPVNGAPRPSAAAGQRRATGIMVFAGPAQAFAGTGRYAGGRRMFGLNTGRCSGFQAIIGRRRSAGPAPLIYFPLPFVLQRSPPITAISVQAAFSRSGILRLGSGWPASAAACRWPPGSLHRNTPAQAIQAILPIILLPGQAPDIIRIGQHPVSL